MNSKRKGPTINRTLIAACCASAALFLAGAALASLTPQQYRAQATAICKGTTAKLGKVATPKNKSEIGKYLKATLPIFKAQYDALGKLDPPKALRYLHGKARGYEKQQLDGIQQLIDKIDGGADPEKAFNETSKKLDPIAKGEADSWNKLKLPACANV